MRIGNFRRAMLSILVIASIVTLAIQLLSNDPVFATQTSHAPIYINGNSQFDNAHGVNGGGNGTSGNPYIIENWDISAENANGIEIRNTTAYFIVRNCYVHDCQNNENYLWGYGIYLYGLVNGRAENNICENNSSDGISLWYTSNNTVDNNTCKNNGGNGIHLEWSGNSTIEVNTCLNNGWTGIQLGSGSNNTLMNNTCDYNDGNGIGLVLSDNNYLTNNTCDNNRGNGIYLGDSSNNTVENNTCENNVHGICLDAQSSNNTLTNNYLTNNTYQNNLFLEGTGIYLLSMSDNNTLENNTCENNNRGIRLEESSKNILRNNICENNSYNFGVGGSEISHFDHDIDNSNLVNWRPIYYLMDRENEVIDSSWNPGYVGLVRCDNIRVENLVLENNGEGVLFAGTDNSWIENCTCSNNRIGVQLESSDNNILANNTCDNNKYYGILLESSSSYNTVNGNTCTGNSWGGIDLEWSSNNNTVTGNNCGSNYYGIYLSSDNNAISNNVVENNSNGIYLDYSGNNILDNNTCENNFDGGITQSYSDNNRVSNNIVENVSNSDHYGITLENSDNNYIENNITMNNYEAGIYLAYSINNVLTGNTADNNHDGIIIEGSDNNLISNNITESNSCDGIDLYSSDNNFVNNNIVKNNDEEGILLQDSNYNSLTNNIVENSHGIYLAYFISSGGNLGSDNNLISSNTFINDGLWVDYSYGNTVENNTVNGGPLVYLEGVSDSNVADAGQVILVRCENITVENLNLSNANVGVELLETKNSRVINNIAENNYAGVYLENCSGNNLISGNIVNNNEMSGIWLTYSSNNLIYSNKMENNYRGICLWEYSENNTISGNIVGNNYEFGIWLLDGSDNNLIYHNNIVNNGTQAYDDGSNFWDNGYPSGGNYWSDYTGVDENHGENQNIPGSDGIGDTPYAIPDSSNQDRYPLMNSYPPPPSVMLTVTATKVDNTHYKLRISHDGGDDLLVNDLEVQASDSSTTMAAYAFPGTGTFSVGMNAVLTCTYSPDCTNQYVTVYIIHKPSNENIFISWSILVQPNSAGTASIRMSGTGPSTPTPFLWGIRKANVTASLTIYQGDNLHLVFLTQDNHTVENDIVIWSRSADNAETVSFTNLIVQHDNGLPYPSGNVKRFKMVLTDNAGNVILDNMAWYTVVQDDWSNRIIWIILNWGSHNSSQQDQLSNEISSIILNWGSCPTSRDQYDYSQL